MSGGKTDQLMERLRNGGSISRHEGLSLVALLSIPAILSELAGVLMSYIDASMLGHLGSSQAAAVGLVSSSIWMCWGLSSAAITGYHVLIGQRIGANDTDSVQALVREAISASLLFALSISLIGCGISPMLPVWLGAPPDVASLATDYFFLYCAGFLFVVIEFLLSGMLRVAGDMKTPSCLNVTMCLLDVVFNALLIFPTSTYHVLGCELTIPGMDMGVRGAALGTILAESITALCLLYIVLIRSPHLKLISGVARFFTFHWLKSSFKIGFPISLQHILLTGAQVAIAMMVAPLGTAAIAAHSLAITAESLCYMPGFGIRSAATTLTAQTFGAKRLELTYTLSGQSIFSGIAVMTGIGIFMFFAADGMMRMMTPDPEIIQLGAAALRIEAFAEPFYAASIVACGCFIGVGDTRIPCIMNLVSMWIVRIPLVYFMTSSMGFIGVWIAMAIELAFRGTIFLIRYRFFDWMHNKKR